MAIVRWDPFGEATRMQQEMDRIFARLGQGERSGEGVAWMPKIDVKRSGDDVMVRAELPGMKPEDVDIELRDNVLTISGDRSFEEQKEDEGWLIRESSYGAFERSLTIPEGVDPTGIKADFHDGVLEVIVPKAFEASQPRRTKIEIGGQGQTQMGTGQQQAAMSGAGQQQSTMAGSSQQQQQRATSEVATGSGASEQGMTEQDIASRGVSTGQGEEAEQRKPVGVGGRDKPGDWV